MSKVNYRILCVCMGNICRSPTAKAMLEKYIINNGLASKVNVDSAGTHGYHIGHAPDKRSQAAALQSGINIADDRSRKITHHDFYHFDEILVMDQDNLDTVESLAPPDATAVIRLMMDDLPEYGLAEVPDPYYGGEAGFVQVVDMLDQVSAVIGQRLVEQLS